MPRFIVPTGRPALSPAAYDPYLQLHREMNRLFDDVFSASRGEGDMPRAAGLAAPALDIDESDDAIRVCAEIPGVRPEDVEVTLQDDRLLISGEKRSQGGGGRENRHVGERAYGRFQRMIQLPFSPDPSQVQADFEHGVLTLKLPKPAEQSRAHRIQVRTAQGAQGGDGHGSQPGVLGDQSQAQDLGQPGHPEAKVSEDEVQEAFGQEREGQERQQGAQPH